jgi:2',3'-cyclic-nucleotide 2'-phosphodiesterase (5'-nucleotidase family)
MIVDASAPPGDRVRDVRVNGQSLQLDRTYTVAIADFIFTGGDGYTAFARQRVLVGPESGNLISVAFEQYVAAQREITQQIDGRITVR